MMDERYVVEVARDEFRNTYGSGLRIVYRCPATPFVTWMPGQDELERRIDLVHGVGPRTAAKLRLEGYERLVDLSRHERFGKGALKVWTALAKRDVPVLLESGAKDVELLPLFRRQDAAVIDIETAGLWQVLPVFLIGYAATVPGGWEIRQFFARSFEEEAPVLHEVAGELAERRVAFTYNGKAFDEPFVRARLGLHGLAPIKFRLHVDLLHTCRRVLGARVLDCRLGTVGAYLYGLTRDDVPGSLVPDLYFQYVRDQDPQAIEPILRHNAIDLLVLGWLAEAAYAAVGLAEANVADGADVG